MSKQKSAQSASSGESAAPLQDSRTGVAGCPKCAEENRLRRAAQHERNNIVRDLWEAKEETRKARARLAALEAQVATSRKALLQCLALDSTDFNSEGDLWAAIIDAADSARAALTATPEVLARVEGLIHAEKFLAGSHIHDDRLAVWRASKCEHPGWVPVTALILSREDQTSCTNLSTSGDSEEVGDE